MPLRFIVGCALGAAVVAFVGAPASAQQNIGAAATTHNDVKHGAAGRIAPLATGDSVFKDESVRTGQESTAKLVFLDSTALAVGPTSSVVLDRFIYDPSPTSQAMAVNLTKGVFRFTTGALDKSAYSIATPTAAIGVRGTVLDIAVQGSRTRVTLVEGRALVCPARKGPAFEQAARDCSHGVARRAPGAPKCDCVELVDAGQTAQVGLNGGQPHASLTTATVDFASLCSGDSSLCSGASPAASFADAGAPGGAALCGR